jgi:hypothetical protein
MISGCLLYDYHLTTNLYMLTNKHMSHEKCKIATERWKNVCRPYFISGILLFHFRLYLGISRKENVCEKRCAAKTLFIIPTDAHYYKIVEMLK